MPRKLFASETRFSNKTAHCFQKRFEYFTQKRIYSQTPNNYHKSTLIFLFLFLKNHQSF